MKIGAGIILAVGTGFFACSVLFAACPLGQKNCPYPGECSKYIDRNKDGICDHSQQAGAVPINVRTETKTLTPAGKVSNTNAPNILPPPPIQQKQETGRLLLWCPLTVTALMVLLSEIAGRQRRSFAIAFRLFWNWLVFLSFLVVIATSVLFVYPLNGIGRDTVAYWHGLGGWFFIFAGIYHVAKICPIKTKLLWAKHSDDCCECPKVERKI